MTEARAAARERVLGAARRLRRAPVFAVSAIAVMALGIGALTAVVTLVDQVVLSPLPVRDQDRLVVAWTHERVRGFAHFPYTAPMFEAAERGAVPAFADVAAVGSWGTGEVVVEDAGGPVPLRWARVLGDFFGVLGVESTVGRMLRAEDDVPSPAEPVVVISDALWQSRYGRSPSAVGSPLVTRLGTFTVVGVAPPGFDYPRGAQVWAPTRPSYPAWDEERPLLELDLVARLATGATAEQAAGQLRDLPPTPELTRTYVNAAPVVRPFAHVVLGDVRPTLFLLLAGAVLLLCVATVDLANLVLVRAVGRRRDLAVRRALGAEPSALMRDAAAEAFLLWIAGAVAGAAVAWLAVRSILPFAPSDLPRLDGVSGLEPTSYLIASGAALLMVAAAVLLPSRHDLRSAPLSALGGRPGDRGRSHAGLRRTLVATQVALAVWVAAIGVLMTRTLLELRSLAPGFRPDDLWVVTLDYRGNGVEGHPGWLEELEATIVELRGRARILDATPLQMPPIPGNAAWQSIAYREDQTAEQGNAENPFLMWEFVLPNAFELLGVPVLRGRGLTEDDLPTATPVVVVNEAAARLYWPNLDPVGQRLWVPWGGGPERPWTVVGVVGDTRYGELTDLRPAIYYPLRQTGTFRSRYLLVRTDGTALSLMRAVADVMSASAPRFRPISVVSVSERLAAPIVRPRFAALLLSVFAAAALLLAGLGVYGVMAYMVRSRRRELGVRMACGATPRRARALVLGQALRVTMVGAGIGLAGAVASGPWFRALLYGVTPSDPGSLAVATLAVVLVAVVACWIPARRAAGVDPSVALRAE